MKDVELLIALLECQQMRQPMIKTNDDELDTDKYLRWAVEAVAHRIWWDNRPKT